MAMSPEVLQLVERYNRLAATLETQMIDRLDKSLDSAYRELEREFLKQYPKLASNGSLVAAQRRAVLMNDLSGLLQVIRPEQQQGYEQMFRQTVEKSSGLGGELAGKLVEAIEPNSAIRPFAGINVEAAALQARDGVQRLYRYNEEFRGKASAIIEQGLIQGWGAQKAAGLLRGELGITKYQAERIARTETLSALNDGAQLRYQQNGAEGVQWCVTRGEVCPYCIARNMQVYETGKVKVPAHPFCRCVLLPWKRSWAEMGLTDDEFSQQYTDERLADLRKQGKEPNFGLTPFERAARLEKPPKPIWKPGDPVLPPQPKPAPATTPPAKPKAKTPDFPKSLDGLETVKPLGGSTGATLVRDPATGKQYVLKRGSNAAHLREEFAADEAYRALGVAVPKAKLYETGTGPAKLAEFIEGRSLAEVLAGNPKEAAKVIRELQRNFAADALLGNWDVAGLNLDNVLVTKTGKVYRIDNGGSLRFRAQGELKGDRWNAYPTELWTLRDAQINSQTARIFNSLSHAQIVDQIEAIAAKEARLLRALPKELRGTVGSRLGEMKRVADISRTLQADQWNDAYISQFTRHSMGLRSEGIIDRLPEELRRKGKGVAVVDAKGKQYDHLRGDDSHMLAVQDYINRNGGNYDLVERWMSGQAGSSWSSESRAFKWFLAGQRNASVDSYFWLSGAEVAQQNYKTILSEGGGERVYANTFSAWHAFNYEMMRRIKFENNDQANRTISLMRTESLEVMQMNKLNPGDRQVVMRRGAAESTSIYQQVNVFGSELTVQQVPYHRILGNYFYERSPGVGGTAFMGDSENEFVCLLDGVPFDYKKPARQFQKPQTFVPGFDPSDPIED